MNLIMPTAVFVLMVSTGMSLERGQFAADWRGLTPRVWAERLLATFLLPPLLVLLIAQVLPIGLSGMAGLYLISVAPGAPLMARNAAKRGEDIQAAAGYQVWGALMAPLMIPPLVAAAALLYGRWIWIPSLEVARVVVEKQLLPLLLGLAAAHWAPGFSRKVRRPLNLAGNAALTVALISVLWKAGPALRESSLWLMAAALILAAGCAVAGHWLLKGSATSPRIPGLCNVNRHVGLAVLLSTAHLPDWRHVVPAIAVYAVAAPLVIALYARWMPARQEERVTAAAP